MNRILVFISLLALAITLISAPQPQSQGATPVFERNTTLLRPTNYREWVFVGSSLGLSYAPEAGMSEMYHNVYIKPEAYREFSKTGRFPEGTVLAMEMLSKDTKKEPALHGSFQSDFRARGCREGQYQVSGWLGLLQLLERHVTVVPRQGRTYSSQRRLHRMP